MTEPITLTKREIAELEHEIAVRVPTYNGIDPLIILHAVINGLNELRKPLPLGTVKADDDGNVAVKVADTVNDQWFVFRLKSARCDGPASDDYLEDWPVVFKPEWDQ